MYRTSDCQGSTETASVAEIEMVRYGYPFFYAKCPYGRHESRINTAPLFCTDEPTSGKWDAVRELGLMIEFGLRRAIRSEAAS